MGVVPFLVAFVAGDSGIGGVGGMAGSAGASAGGRLVDFLRALIDETFTPEIPAVVPSGLAPVGLSPLTDNEPATTAGAQGAAQGAAS